MSKDEDRMPTPEEDTRNQALMTKDIQKWADPAMYPAQEQPDEPQVQLLSCTPDPLGAIAAAAGGYSGRFYRSLREISDEQRKFCLNDVQKGILAAPLEFVNLHFRITGVSRGFTHQMVRQRTACYVQESTRFAVKEHVPVALPPSLIGTIDWHSWEQKCALELYPNGADWTDLTRPQQYEKQKQIWVYAEKHASKEQLWRRKWDEHNAATDETYNWFVNDGMPAEDARGLLPTNLLTQLNYTTTLRHLIDHAGVRLCTQAQFEWRTVWIKMLDAIRRYGDDQWYDRPLEPLDLADRSDLPGYPHFHAGWQFNAIANIFKPICYKTGKCEFMTSVDRYCSIRDRVQANALVGTPSSEWGKDRGMGTVKPIHDSEWLADPTSARPS